MYNQFSVAKQLKTQLDMTTDVLSTSQRDNRTTKAAPEAVPTSLDSVVKQNSLVEQLLIEDPATKEKLTS